DPTPWRRVGSPWPRCQPGSRSRRGRQISGGPFRRVPKGEEKKCGRKNLNKRSRKGRKVGDRPPRPREKRRMNKTRQSLLFRAQSGEADAWKDLTDLYRPLIIGWLNRQGVPAVDLEDLSQDVLLRVVKHLPAFEHSGNKGAFRSWLRTIVCSRTNN